MCRGNSWLSFVTPHLSYPRIGWIFDAQITKNQKLLPMKHHLSPNQIPTNQIPLKSHWNPFNHITSHEIPWNSTWKSHWNPLNIYIYIYILSHEIHSTIPGKVPLNPIKSSLNPKKITIKSHWIPLNHHKITIKSHWIPFNHHQIPFNHRKIPFNHHKIT